MSAVNARRKEQRIMDQNNGCNCAEPCDEYHGWRCAVTGGACMYLLPDAVACAKDYGEGPLAYQASKMSKTGKRGGG